MNKEREIHFCVNHAVDDGKLYIDLEGNKELFSLIFSSKKYVNELDSVSFLEARKLILNTALNICNEDEEIRNKFLVKLTEINKK